MSLPLLDYLAKKEKHAAAVRLGISRAKYWNEPIGRPRESVADFLNKPLSKKIALALTMGCSIKASAIVCQCSATTVKKVKKLLKTSHKTTAKKDAKPLMGHLSDDGKTTVLAALRWG